MRLALFIVALSSAAVVGCDRQAAPKKQIDVKAPGVEVKVDPQTGVDVKTPAVDVETK